MESDKLREYLKTLDAALGQRADMLWSLAAPIHARQSRPDSNENGAAHCQMVSSNIWRLLHDSGTLDRFSPTELFLLSCCACCHDFDKGLSSAIPVKMDHGEASGVFVIDHSSPLVITHPESIAISLIVSIHDKNGKDLVQSVGKLPVRFPLPGDVADLQKLAVVLKAADVLHTDNSRVSDLAVDMNKLTGFEKAKHLARQCITGWYVDGTRIIVTAYPRSSEQMDALSKCIEHMKKREWPVIRRILRNYCLPHKLQFEVGRRLLQEAAMTATTKPLPASVVTLRDVFQFYCNVVKPLYTATQSRDCFPLDWLSEIHAAFDHLSRHWCQGEAETAAARSAYQHLRRACFDMFKLEMVDAMNQYRKLAEIDTSTIDNGRFDKKLHQMIARIRERAIQARQSEGQSATVSQAFDLWSSVYADCVALQKDFFLHPDVSWSRKRRRWFRW